VCRQADKGTSEQSVASVECAGSTVHLKIAVKPENELDLIPEVVATFSYSPDGKQYTSIGEKFSVREGAWVGAKVGLFALGGRSATDPGYADFDWFRIEPLADR
jgi:hypothetical protein